MANEKENEEDLTDYQFNRKIFMMGLSIFLVFVLLLIAGYIVGYHNATVRLTDIHTLELEKCIPLNKTWFFN